VRDTYAVTRRTPTHSSETRANCADIVCASFRQDGGSLARFDHEVKLFIAEPLSNLADALFAHLAADPPGRLMVPDLFFIECANILWKHVRRFGYPVVKARSDLRNLEKLALQRIPTVSLMTDALDIAVAQVVSAYDACYVALAYRLGIPFVTADDKLAHMLANTPYAVFLLGDFPIPPLPSP